MTPELVTVPGIGIRKLAWEAGLTGHDDPGRVTVPGIGSAAPLRLAGCTVSA